MKYKLRKTNRKIRNKTNLYLFYLMGIIVLSLSVGYSAITSDVSISGEAAFRVEEELRVSNVTLYETTYNGQESYTPKYTKDTLTLGVDLTETGSTVTYKMELINYGTVAQRVSSIDSVSNSNNNATYELVGYSANTLIYPGETAIIYITIKYKTNVSVLPEITTVDLILGTEYITPESTLAQGNGSGATSTFFNSGPIQKGEVESIEFLPTLEVGEDALGFWDASKTLDGTVMAWYTDTDEDSLYELYIGGNGKVYVYSDAKYLFEHFTNTKSITFGEYVDTSNVVYMGDYNNTEQGMFVNCSSLISLDLSSFDTRNVTNMKYMFEKCSALESIVFGNNFDTSKVTTMYWMFKECSSLSSLNLTNFNTSKVTNMNAMFQGLLKITNITLGEYFDTSKVTDMGSMFNECKILTSLDLSGFTLKENINLSYMFRMCNKLMYLDIRNCEFVNANTTYTFNYLSASCNIIVKSDTERDFLLGLKSSFANIQTVAELESA